MRDETTPRLAAAFLALSDADEPEPPRRLTTAALIMAVVIALATPLAWLTSPVGKPSDLPLATPASKAVLPAPADDGADG